MRIKRTQRPSRKYFTGEMMTCAACHKHERSDPQNSSGWTVIEVDGFPTYICPECFAHLDEHPIDLRRAE